MSEGPAPHRPTAVTHPSTVRDCHPGATDWAQSGVTLGSLKGFPDFKAIYGISSFPALTPLCSFGIVLPSSTVINVSISLLTARVRLCTDGLFHPVHSSCRSVLCHLSARTGSELRAAPSFPAAQRVVTIVGSFPSCAERGLCPEQRRGVQWPLWATRHVALLSEQEWQPGVWTGSSEVVLCNLQKVGLPAP